jgi:hypothetical protein
MSFDFRALVGALAVSFIAAPGVLADDREDVIAAVDAVYAVISGPVGQDRDFDAMRAMFLPGAVMGPVGPGPDGQGRAATMDVDGYIERSGPFLVENGFTEVATRTEVSLYGELAVVRSAYEGTNGSTGEIVVSGVNFMTLFKVDGEWKYAALLWRAASEDWPVEAAFDD